MMWHGLLKVFLFYTVVVAFQEFFIAGCYVFRRRRVASIRWLLRGMSWLAVAALGFWLVRMGRMQSWDAPEVLGIAMLPLLTWFAIEIYIKVRLEHLPWTSLFELQAQPRPQIEARSSSARMVLITGLGMGLVVTEFSIVSIFVSPELLGVGWWFVAIALAVMLGLFLGFYFAVVDRVTHH